MALHLLNKFSKYWSSSSFDRFRSELPDLKSGIPADEKHLHFGKGQTQTFIELDPGEHSLQLLKN